MTFVSVSVTGFEASPAHQSRQERGPGCPTLRSRAQYGGPGVVAYVPELNKLNKLDVLLLARQTLMAGRDESI